MELAGRVALVTGGATGIGRAAVLRLARAGAAGVAINYRSSAAEAERVADEVRGVGAEPLCIRADVRSDVEVRSMIGRIGARFGRLDVLVNNAGVTRWIALADLESLTDEIWDEILDVNLKGAFRCARAAASLLAEGEGMIVNVASISGVQAPPTISSLAYGAAKAALIHMTRLLAVALAPRVRVNAVAPAFTDTRWLAEHFGDAYEETKARAAARYPLRRVGAPDDVAGAILGLITGGDFVTGQTLLVDGGVSLS
jgi:3-oxoacyl-[acyl-carrier protein] reductase